MYYESEVNSDLGEELTRFGFIPDYKYIGPGSEANRFILQDSLGQQWEFSKAWFDIVPVNGLGITLYYTKTLFNARIKCDYFNIINGYFEQVGLEYTFKPYTDPTKYSEAEKMFNYALAYNAKIGLIGSGLGYSGLVSSAICNRYYCLFDKHNTGKIMDTFYIPKMASGILLFSVYPFKVNKVNILGSIDTIPTGLFRGSGAKSIRLGDGVRVIGKNCLMDNSISHIEFPSTLRKLCDDALSYNKDLLEIKFNGPLEYLGDSVFAYCESLRHIELPEGLLEIPLGTFSYCKNLAYIKIPKTVQKLSEHMLHKAASASKQLIIEAPGHLRSQLSILNDLYKDEIRLEFRLEG